MQKENRHKADWATLERWGIDLVLGKVLVVVYMCRCGCFYNLYMKQSMLFFSQISVSGANARLRTCPSICLSIYPSFQNFLKTFKQGFKQHSKFFIFKNVCWIWVEFYFVLKFLKSCLLFKYKSIKVQFASGHNIKNKHTNISILILSL